MPYCVLLWLDTDELWEFCFWYSDIFISIDEYIDQLLNNEKKIRANPSVTVTAELLTSVLYNYSSLLIYLTVSTLFWMRQKILLMEMCQGTYSYEVIKC